MSSASCGRSDFKMTFLQTAGVMGVIFIGVQAFMFWKNRTDLAMHDELKTRKRSDIVTQLEWERQRALADAPARVLNKNALTLEHLDVSFADRLLGTRVAWISISNSDVFTSRPRFSLRFLCCRAHRHLGPTTSKHFALRLLEIRALAYSWSTSEPR